MTDVVETVVGPATALHRLALAVECLDALASRRVPEQLDVGLEASGGSPARPLQRTSSGCFALLYPQRLPTTLVLRVDDASRQYQPRRLGVHPWAVAEVAAPDPYVPARARLVRLWLWPGSAYRLPRTATTIRGRVTRDGEPARWCRVLAVGPTAADAGWAHTDERGEFLLVISDAGQVPVGSTVTVDLVVTAVKDPVAPDVQDRCADLVVEDVPRSTNPPQPVDLDNPVLRGVATPTNFSPNLVPARSVTVPVGVETNLDADPLVFVPQP